MRYVSNLHCYKHNTCRGCTVVSPTPPAAAARRNHLTTGAAGDAPRWPSEGVMRA
jgi:hypothetical protein